MAFSHAGVIRKADVVALPEPNRARALENHRSERECDQVLAERIETLLRIAASNGCETLVCGALGCGRGGFDTQQVIGLLEDWIRKHPGVIGRIVFAVEKDTITDLAGIAHCRATDYERIAKSGFFAPGELRSMRHTYGIDVLAPDRFAFAENFKNIAVDKADIDVYMGMMLKGEVR